MALRAPAPHLAARLLAPVDPGRRLPGYRLHPRIGVQRLDPGSLAEALLLLSDPLGRLDTGLLAAWVLDELEDGELAERIAAVHEGPGSPAARCAAVAQLLEARLLAAAAVIGGSRS